MDQEDVLNKLKEFANEINNTLENEDTREIDMFDLLERIQLFIDDNIGY